MSMMLRRRVMMAEGGSGPTPPSENGWKHIVYTAAADTTSALTTIDPIKATIPSGYRYAIALADDREDPENNAFLGAILLPTRTDIHMLRWRNDAYDQQINPNNSHAFILRAGQTVTVWYRTAQIGTDKPQTDWGYECIAPGPISKADEVKSALTSVGTWNAMLAVADLDYANVLEQNSAYCESITLDSASMTGSYVRWRNNAYAAGTSWGSNYETIVDAGTKIACFYL